MLNLIGISAFMYGWALKVVLAVLLIYLVIILMWSSNYENKISKNFREVQAAPENLKDSKDSKDFAAILKARELRDGNKQCGYLRSQLWSSVLPH